MMILVAISIMVEAKYIVNPYLERNDSYEVVIDSEYKLMWQDNIDVKTIKMNWTDAKKFCNNLNLGSFNDWRLPSKNELITILDTYEHNPIISTIFKHKKVGLYWSITEWENNPKSFAWFISFAYGQSYVYLKDSQYYVRCVREDSLGN